MDFFFCENIPEPELTVELSPNESRHAFVTLRKQQGEQICIIDGKGNIAVAEIIANQKLIVISRQHIPQNKPLFHLFFSLPHIKNKTELIISQAAELGVNSIIPILTERSVSKPEDIPSKWKNRIIEACKQSKNPYLPNIKDIMTLEESAKFAKKMNIACFFGDPENGLPPEQITDFNYTCSNMGWFVGPEGGFSIREIQLLLDNNFKALKISDRILRIETACSCGIITLFTLAKFAKRQT